MKLTCCLIDTDATVVTQLMQYIDQCTDLEFTGKGETPASILNKILNNEMEPDITFLDIALLDGVIAQQQAELLREKTNIVIITEHRHYAPEAYQLGSVDYILKPFNNERFLQSIGKVKRKRLTAINKTPYCFIPGDRKGLKLKVTKSEVQYVQSLANYTKIVTHKKNYVTYLSLNNTLQLLANNSIVRVHKSYLVNINYIHSIDAVSVYMDCNKLIPIGPYYKEAFLNRISGN